MPVAAAAASLLLIVLAAAPAGQAPEGGRTASQSAAPAAAAAIDLANAVIVLAPGATPRERKAAQMLAEEVQKRTQLHLPVADRWPEGGRPAIALGRVGAAQAGGGRGARPKLAAPGAEGYQVAVAAGGSAPTVWVLGADERGVMFGAGRLLREFHMARRELRLPAGFAVSETPATRLRGHQLGFRPKTNSYDGWDVAMWEQYIRDLTVFGNNAIELIPPRSDDAPDSPHFPRPQMEMMVEMSRIADEYGLDVWIWYPALDKDYGDPATVDFALKEWADVFRRLPRVDAVFVPGGDPGHTQPRHMFALLEKQTASLKRFHEHAQMWMSPQGFTAAWMDEFYGLMQGSPAWLTGIVFGPQVRDPLPLLRKKIPARYPIRRYPDITHSLRAQYPVPFWDVAHALTSAREPINPRPVDQTIIFRAFDELTPGFITYSEGCNDDVNKIVWSALGWNASAEPLETLRQYSRYFIGPRYTDIFAHGLLALERNWRGPLLANAGVETTLQQFQAMEREASPQVRLNWRFQQALYRAYYDAYQRRRLLHERSLEEEAMTHLRRAPAIGARAALDAAEEALGRSAREPVARDLRQRIGELAEALYQSIRMQLDVDRYGAIAVGRGATLDTVDMPLNDRMWLTAQFADIRALADEQVRLDRIARIVGWTDPGPGGFYDDLGDTTRQPHLVSEDTYARDPQSFTSPATGFGYRPGWRISWMTHAESFYDAPVQMRYTGLDPTARYRVRVVYAGDVYSTKTTLRLTADDAHEVHPWMPKPQDPAPLAFDVPVEATRDGQLTLTWRQQPGAGSAGRGTQIAEVWLERAGPEPAAQTRRD